MPTTVGHAVAGIGAAWAADLIPGRRAWRTAPPGASWYRRAGNGLTLACGVIATLPDTDLLFHIHRTYTHSLGAVLFAALFAAAMAANANRPIARVALMCAAAYASHLVLDWLAVDLYPPRGIQVFWPLSQTFYISGCDLFRRIERREFLTWPSIETNLAAIAQELLILAPLLALIWLIREKALARLATQLSRGDHAAQ